MPRPFALLNDEPVGEGDADLLGARRAAFQLARLLRSSHRSTPFTLAVDAGWGMGKSSLMRLVNAELRTPALTGAEPAGLAPAPQVHTVWYNAWTSTGGDALEGLIKSVLNSFDPNVLRRAVRRASERPALVRALRALAVVLGRPLGLSRLIDDWWASMSVDPKARNEMRDALGAIVADWAGTTAENPGRMLVVFIDDLDRCEEATVLAVCEAVKVYLDVPGLAFVIGCDRAAIGPGGLLRDLSPAGAAFMEKIFQTSYRVPAGSPADLRAYVLHCARESGIAHLIDPNLADLLAYRAARNPRRVKRLVNGLLLEAMLNPIWEGISPEAVIRTLLLQYLYPDFHRMMTLPAGPVGDDVVGEFLHYRRVRPLLRAQAPLSERERRSVAAFLTREQVPPMDLGGDRLAVLSELEQQLPTDFPALVTDASFTSLLDELLELDDADEVLRRLRDGVDTARGVAPAQDPPQPGGASYEMPLDTRPAGYGQAPPASSAGVPLPRVAQGARPDPSGGVSHEEPGGRVVVFSHRLATAAAIGGLVAAGYQVSEAPTEAMTDRYLDMADPVRLLICDVDTEDGAESGFDYVERLRAAGRYTGPVIFYTSRLTPSRIRRATALHAIITSDVARLPGLFRSALAPAPASQPASQPAPHPAPDRS